ncbi:MAG: BatA domain-containing protein [Rubripirellula sp.]|nr:BatA domain-containing protein [Rubripirellula sp.]
MSFLQPAMLFALPAIALPIIIHLINQRRFQTVNWAAMQFLLTATKMSRGYARLRQWLILAARTLAVAGLLFAVARPLSSGLLGIAAGGQADTTIVLLDRSASMTQRGPEGESKLQSGLNQLVDSLTLVPSGRYVLIDSAIGKPQEFESPEDLLKAAESKPVSATADLTKMLETTEEYLRANRPSRCEICICSDVRKADWKPDSGQWETVRRSLLELPQMIRFHLLAYPELDKMNRSLRITSVQRIQRESGAELLLSLRIEQGTAESEITRIPIRLEIDGARSEFEIEMSGGQFDLVNYAIPIDSSQTRGWGRVSIPSDSHPADNEYFFVYDQSIERKTWIVAEDPETVVPLKLVASVPPQPNIVCSATILTPEQVIETADDQPALVIWQAAIPGPDDPTANWLKQVKAPILFFPPERIGGESYAGVRWTEWRDAASQVSTWVGDQGLLASTQSGAALPLGDLTVQRAVGIRGDTIALATLDGDAPLLSQAITEQGQIYFMGTTVAPMNSSLATDGIVIYAMIQRAIAIGTQTQGNTRQLIAGSTSAQRAQGWQQIAGDSQALSTNYPLHAGIYRDGERLLAVNRSEAEDQPFIVPRDQVASLFGDLDFDRIDDRAGNSSSLIREIWRLFLIGMLVALIAEAVLCLPKRVAQKAVSNADRTGSDRPLGRGSAT